jgi:hypothetical protein
VPHFEWFLGYFAIHACLHRCLHHTNGFQQFYDANLVLVECFVAIMDRYLPPEILFDAQLDIPATLAANMATFQGAPLPRDLLQRWMPYAGPRLEPPGRIPVISVVEFVELPIWGRDLEGEGQAAKSRSTGRGSCERWGRFQWTRGFQGYRGRSSLRRTTAAARGGEEQAAVKARAKAMNDMFGNRARRVQRVLQDHPTNRRADH